ncbi:MAG: thiamine pyrophosphate-dependent enzyme [Pirellulaceae bacterium]|nr:thiamine pyrophosphate-dependent enzyme [Pirellulaceae bacterium]
MNEQAQMTYNKLELLKLMYLSREGDRREGVLHRQSKGWFQVAGMGHEAMAVIPMLMEDDDYLFPYYRDRAMVLSRGVSNAELATVYFAKRGSSSGGRQMPGHYSHRERNVWSVPTPTGANALPACGVAWSMQLKGTKNLAIATVGDAASRQGEFYEAISFAVERNLPVVFIVEDNQYGISTNTMRFNPFRLGIFNDDIPVQEVDARHPDRLFEAVAPAMEKARNGGGPTVLWCHVDRLCSHTSSDDHRVYRPQDEIDAMQGRDPIIVVAQELIEAGELTAEDWESCKEAINEQVDQEYQAAEHEEDPQASDLTTHMFGPEPVPTAPPLEGGRKWRMVDAMNSVFRNILANDDDRVFFGEDIEDPKGGVFRLTAGLSENHPERVFNAPLAEATIMGVGCGMASYGMKPVFELQFVDFMGPGWNQISQNLATLRWRTYGNWTCPMVIYAPYGAYLPGGSIWHSQANESLFAHVPGLRVVVPSTPEDAAALIWTSMHSEDPVIFLIPKHLFRLQMEVPEEVPAVGFGSARVRKAGEDVTLVTWGNCTEHSLAAAKQLEGEVSVEVIDLRCIVPWDRAAVVESLEKTGRLVVVQEDGRSSSVGQMIISEIAGDPESWSLFFSAPQLVSKADVHIGYNPIYEYAALPSTEEVVNAIRLTMED